jgi:hypothetical protein
MKQMCIVRGVRVRDARDGTHGLGRHGRAPAGRLTDAQQSARLRHSMPSSAAAGALEAGPGAICGEAARTAVVVVARSFLARVARVFRRREATLVARFAGPCRDGGAAGVR